MSGGRLSSDDVDELEGIATDLRGIACLLGDLGESPGNVDREGIGWLAGHVQTADLRLHNLLAKVAASEGAR